MLEPSGTLAANPGASSDVVESSSLLEANGPVTASWIPTASLDPLMASQSGDRHDGKAVLSLLAQAAATFNDGDKTAITKAPDITKATSPVAMLSLLAQAAAVANEGKATVSQP
jgi:hypothetical protein